MNLGNTVVAGDIILLALVAAFVVAGLTVSLIAITLTSIKEAGGRTPEWPVSWPEPPATLPAQRVPTASGQAVLPPQQVTLPSPRAGVPEQSVTMPQRVGVPSQRASLPREKANPLS